MVVNFRLKKRRLALKLTNLPSLSPSKKAMRERGNYACLHSPLTAHISRQQIHHKTAPLCGQFPLCRRLFCTSNFALSFNNWSKKVLKINCLIFLFIVFPQLFYSQLLTNHFMHDIFIVLVCVAQSRGQFPLSFISMSNIFEIFLPFQSPF